jgi:hypothetical protein
MIVENVVDTVVWDEITSHRASTNTAIWVNDTVMTNLPSFGFRLLDSPVGLPRSQQTHQSVYSQTEDKLGLHPTNPARSLLRGLVRYFLSKRYGFPCRDSGEDRSVGVNLIVVLLVVLIVLALVGSIAVSPLLWVLVVILVLFAVLGRGRYYARRG